MGLDAVLKTLFIFISMMVAGFQNLAQTLPEDAGILMALSRKVGTGTTTYNPALDPRTRSYFNASEFSGYTNGQLIAQWTDLSTNGRNAVQSVDTNKPVWADGWLNFDNGAGGRWLLWDSGPVMTNDHTLFVLLDTPYALASTGLVNYLSIRVSTSNNTALISINGNATTQFAQEHFMFTGQDSAGVPAGVAYGSTTPNIIGAGSRVWTFAQTAPTNIFIRLNNAEVTNTLTVTLSAISSTREIHRYQRIGGRADLRSNYKIKVWLLFSEYLNDDDQTQVYNWMNTQ